MRKGSQRDLAWDIHLQEALYSQHAPPRGGSTVIATGHLVWIRHWLLLKPAKRCHVNSLNKRCKRYFLYKQVMNDTCAGRKPHRFIKEMVMLGFVLCVGYEFESIAGPIFLRYGNPNTASTKKEIVLLLRCDLRCSDSCDSSSRK
ncbi:hypothetical protein YC2023_059095 [Brassica napus]